MYRIVGDVVRPFTRVDHQRAISLMAGVHPRFPFRIAYQFRLVVDVVPFVHRRVSTTVVQVIVVVVRLGRVRVLRIQVRLYNDQRATSPTRASQGNGVPSIKYERAPLRVRAGI